MFRKATLLSSVFPSLVEALLGVMIFFGPVLHVHRFDNGHQSLPTVKGAILWKLMWFSFFCKILVSRFAVCA